MALDPNVRDASLLRARLHLPQCPHTNLHPNPLHRLRPRRRLGNRNALHLPPHEVQRPLRLLRRSLFRRRPHRRGL